MGNVVLKEMDMVQRVLFSIFLLFTVAFSAFAAPMTIASVQMEVTEELEVNLVRGSASTQQQ